MVGEQYAHDQGANLGTEPHGREAHAADHQREQHAHEHQQLIVPGKIQQPIEERAHEWQQEDRQCPDIGALATEHREHHECDDILHDENADGRAAVEYGQLPPRFQQFCRQDGGGEG